MYGQESQMESHSLDDVLQTEEAKIQSYISEKMAEPFPADVLAEYINAPQEDGDHNHIHWTPSDAELTDFKTHFYRAQYFQTHPEAVKAIRSSQKNLGPETMTDANQQSAPPLNCPNGNFEAGLGNYVGLSNSTTGGNGNYFNGNCGYIPTSGALPNSMAYFASIPQTEQIELTNNIPDPILATASVTLMQTNNGSNHAVKINAATNSHSTANNCSGSRIVDGIERTFTTTANSQTSVSLSYALVMEDPSHTNANPFFVARLLDANGDELPGRICRVADANNTTFFNVLNGNLCGLNQNSNQEVVYSNWICEQLTFPQGTGQTYTLQIFVADCGASAHNSYAYVDDICINCGPNDDVWGYLDLQATDTCDQNMQVCATYTPPQVNGVQGTIVPNSVTLTILQGGTSTGIVLTNPTINTTTQTICFNVSPSDFGSFTGGFDFQIDADFTLGGNTLSRTDVHTNAGPDNDYVLGADCCECGKWTKGRVYHFEPTQYLQSFKCNSSIVTTLQAEDKYGFRFRYLCDGDDCYATYTVTHTLNGSVTTTTSANGYLWVKIQPDKTDCGLQSITVTPYCDGEACPPCTVYFWVDGCDECVEPEYEKIECDPVTGNPVFEFCLKNIGTVPVQYFGFNLPAGISINNLTPPATASVYYNTVLNEWIMDMGSPVAVGATACTFSFEITSGIYQGQQFCINVKSFTDVQPNGNFQNCCPNPVPLCFTIPDCPDDCADILYPSIYCNSQGQRILRYKIRNNFYAQLDSYESFTVNGTPTDNFNGYWNPPVMNGNISPWVYHTIPSSIPAGSQYCFTNTVHMNYSASTNTICDSICYTDTVCVLVPSCQKPAADVAVSPNPVVGGGKGGNMKEGGSQVFDATKFFIAPNPTFDRVSVTSSNGTIYNIRLTDMSGKVIHERIVDEQNEVQVEMKNYSSGLYFITVNDQYTYKVIKKD